MLKNKLERKESVKKARESERKREKAKESARKENLGAFAFFLYFLATSCLNARPPASACAKRHSCSATSTEVCSFASKYFMSC